MASEPSAIVDTRRRVSAVRADPLPVNVEDLCERPRLQKPLAPALELLENGLRPHLPGGAPRPRLHHLRPLVPSWGFHSSIAGPHSGLRSPAAHRTATSGPLMGLAPPELRPPTSIFLSPRPRG